MSRGRSGAFFIIAPSSIFCCRAVRRQPASDPKGGALMQMPRCPCDRQKEREKEEGEEEGEEDAIMDEGAEKVKMKNEDGKIRLRMNEKRTRAANCEQQRRKAVAVCFFATLVADEAARCPTV
eukprot:3161532-Pyramimonas_sp.AAC.1